MCASLLSTKDKAKLVSTLKGLQVGEFMVSGSVYVGDSDTPTTKPLVVHSKSPEDVVPANGPLAIPVPSDTEPILPPAQIDLLLPLDALDDCDDEEAAPSKPETVTENACPLCRIRLRSLPLNRCIFVMNLLLHKNKVSHRKCSCFDLPFLHPFL